MLVAKVARLTNDGSTLGPGAYNVDQSFKTIAQSPRLTTKWAHSKSKRPDHFNKTFQSNQVSPASYSAKKNQDRSILNPTIPRQKYATRGFGS